jgi:hypothetical protein
MPEALTRYVIQLRRSVDDPAAQQALADVLAPQLNAAPTTLAFFLATSGKAICQPVNLENANRIAQVFNRVGLEVDICVHSEPLVSAALQTRPAASTELPASPTVDIKAVEIEPDRIESDSFPAVISKPETPETPSQRYWGVIAGYLALAFASAALFALIQHPQASILIMIQHLRIGFAVWSLSSFGGIVLIERYRANPESMCQEDRIGGLLGGAFILFCSLAVIYFSWIVPLVVAPRFVSLSNTGLSRWLASVGWQLTWDVWVWSNWLFVHGGAVALSFSVSMTYYSMFAVKVGIPVGLDSNQKSEKKDAT